jgi:NitT/TauT family transport system ATP-binding protein
MSENQDQNQYLSQSSPLLRLSDAALIYPGESSFVFEGIELEVFEREIVVLLGQSGCGKSSLLSLAGALTPPSRGYVFFRGREVKSTPKTVAVAFQNPCLLPWLDVAGNVNFALGFKSLSLPSSERKQRVALALSEVGLESYERLHPDQLSGGMAQRVSLARALARRAELLLLDEPFSSLDAATRASMQELLINVLRRHRGSALLVTHDLDEAILLADRLMLMGGAQPSSILKEWNIKEIFKDNGERTSLSLERRDRRSDLFLDLRDQIEASLGGESLS